MSNADREIRQESEPSDWAGRVTRRDDVVVLRWWDGMTDMTLDDFRWLVEVAGPAILGEADEG